jgi:phospholipid transport system substrate-binding protein
MCCQYGPYQAPPRRLTGSEFVSSLKHPPIGLARIDYLKRLGTSLRGGMDFRFGKGRAMSRAQRLATAGLIIGLAAALASGSLGRPASAAPPSAPSSGDVQAPTAETPAAAVDTLYAALLDVMREGPQLGGEGRYRKLEPVIDRVFNLPLMTQVAVGPHWSTLTPEQQRKLIDAFRRFTVATYARHFDNYEGERFEIDPNPQPIPAGLLVKTKLITRDHKPVQLDYVLRENNGRWQVVDVYAQGTISELARRRSEFTSVLSRDGADALADRLVEKAQTLINSAA